MVCQTSGLETGRSHLINLRERLEQYLTEKQDGAMRKLTVSDFNTVLFATQCNHERSCGHNF